MSDYLRLNNLTYKHVKSLQNFKKRRKSHFQNIFLSFRISSRKKLLNQHQIIYKNFPYLIITALIMQYLLFIIKKFLCSKLKQRILDAQILVNIIYNNKMKS